MLDYAALAALAAVIREGSFEKAATALHVTPSAVSQRIRALEVRIPPHRGRRYAITADRRPRWGGVFHPLADAGPR